ncbi:MAG: epoxyqueuosine reductase, partial [Pseudomonadota bacterium]
MDKLSRTAMDFALSNGAALAGIATLQTLAGGPPSADITYVLPAAKSAVIFAVPLDQNLIPPYLGKKDRLSHERDNIRANAVCSG